MPSKFTQSHWRRIFWWTRRNFYVPPMARKCPPVRQQLPHIPFSTVSQTLLRLLTEFKKKYFFSDFQNRTFLQISSSECENATQTQFCQYKKIKGPLEIAQRAIFIFKYPFLRLTNQFICIPYRFLKNFLF